MMRRHKPAFPRVPVRENQLRARRAESALAGLQYDTGADECDVLSDLLADLMHWCDQTQQNFETELIRARFHYECEADEP